MHELSIARQLLTVADREAKLHGWSVVESVTVSVGLLSDIEPTALDFAFGGARSLYTGFEQCNLAIMHQPATAHCPSCVWHGELTELRFDCPRCGKRGLRVDASSEVTITAMTVGD